MGTVSVPMLGMDEQALSFLDGPHLGDGRAQEKVSSYFNPGNTNTNNKLQILKTYADHCSFSHNEHIF